MFASRFILKAQIKKLEAEKDVIRQDPSLGWIPENYRMSLCYDKLKEYAQYNRASSVREALDLLSRELHELKMELSAIAMTAQ
ncbi:MAG: hypothetical protein IJT87_05120 [Ruminiclostridium sp.]|nr:hypothetical protein [Ruminiclostridium sp.]